MKHVHNLVRIAPASERFFRFAKQRAPIFGPFWSSLDIPASKTMIVQCSPKKDTIFSQYFGGLKLQTYLTEMLSARFVSEGISDFVEVEAAIDDWLDAGSIDASHKIHLMLSTADNQTVKSGLLGHQLSGRDFTGAAGEDADQGDVGRRSLRRQWIGPACPALPPQ
jgi:hypothetical protein